MGRLKSGIQIEREIGEWPEDAASCVDECFAVSSKNGVVHFSQLGDGVFSFDCNSAAHERNLGRTELSSTTTEGKVDLLN